MGGGNSPKSWDTTYDEAWAQQVAEWDWSDEGDKLRIEGKCPRCEHTMTREIERGTVRLNLALPETDRGTAPVPVVVRCNCDQPHTGRPEGERGCGKQAMFSLPL